jgi:DNA repair photolyase
MRVIEKTCKTALSYSGIYGWVYALNPYRGCAHGCRYCFAPNILRTTRADWGEFLEIKTNIPNILAKELKARTPGLVGLSSVTDPYQEQEEKTKLTRFCLEQLLRYGFPVSIITKSPLILRDTDLLKQFKYSEVTLTITTIDKDLARLLEPHAPAVNERLEALRKLSADGFNTYAFLGPLLPSLDLDEVPEFLDRIEKTGVGTVMVDTLNLKPGIWPALEQVLEGTPKVKAKFHDRLFQDTKYYPLLFESIKQECNARGINFE